jgi:hypothetical protein
MKSYDFLTEGIVEDAHEMHQDHEVQMARKDCYQAAENAIALHKLLRHVSENQGIEGWVAAKITLASDYLNTVREYLEYELMNQHSEPMAGAPVSVEFPIAESRQIDESKMKDLDLDLKKPPVGMTDQAFKKKYNMTKAEANSKFSAKKEVEEGVIGKKKPKADSYHIVGKDGKPVNLASYNDRASAEKDRDEKHPGAKVQQVGARGKVKGVTENVDANTIWNQYGHYSKDDLMQEFPQLSPKDAQTIVNFAEYGWTNMPNRQEYRDEVIKRVLHAMSGRQGVSEMSAGSVATVVNPTPKNKAKVGTLFGGTYQREEADTPSKKRMFNKKA